MVIIRLPWTCGSAETVFGLGLESVLLISDQPFPQEVLKILVQRVYMPKACPVWIDE